MSYKANLVRLAIKWAPKFLVLWVANIILKGIAELTYFAFDIDTRKAYVAINLAGESETIEVWIENFYVIGDETSLQFIIQQARSNRIWLNNLLAHVAGKAWKIPEIPQYSAQLKLVAELLEAKD
ncbi:hypothetical protein [Methylococcus geothermalis]|uniref:Uncharacterized protein n=1 Tax=Methylococcus geothermalis TaxID=2681310 RepID=A0A858QAM3_9GAMM|nr:hypothetical protein [Methylococcus geothermalis]QJD30939.1 hypothetical protein GNH96_13920 [Methylococcus geothermalis]